MIDLTAAFEKIGKKFQLGLMNRVMRQQGVDGGRYSPPKPSTGRSRKVQRLKRGSGMLGGVSTIWGGAVKSFRRLYVTGNYAKGAFKYAFDASGVTVFASENLHPDGATYADITRYNSRNWEPNKNITSPPMVFPKTTNEVVMMTDEMAFARKTLADEITRQLRNEIPERTEIVIG